MGDDEGWRSRLQALRRKGNCRITTRGRRTGRRHTVPVWFAVGPDGQIWLATLRMDRDWPKNLLRNPDVEIEVGDLRLRGSATLVEVPGQRESIEQVLRSKYVTSRIAAWLGFRAEGVFEVRVTGGV